jgi:hypothetical protein
VTSPQKGKNWTILINYFDRVICYRNVVETNFFNYVFRKTSNLNSKSPKIIALQHGRPGECF